MLGGPEGMSHEKADLGRRRCRRRRGAGDRTDGVFHAAVASAGETTRVSVGSGGPQGTNITGRMARPQVNQDGTVVVFESFASTVVSGDTNDNFDAFVRDRKLGTTTHLSVDSADAETLGGGSYQPAISDNGRRVAFASDATNLVTDDTNGVRDVFVRDRRGGTTVRVSVGAAGVQGDGQSDGPGIRGGTTFGPDISGDGRLVGFDSIATNLVADDTNLRLRR